MCVAIRNLALKISLWIITNPSKKTNSFLFFFDKMNISSSTQTAMLIVLGCLVFAIMIFVTITCLTTNKRLKAIETKCAGRNPETYLPPPPPPTFARFGVINNLGTQIVSPPPEPTATESATENVDESQSIAGQPVAPADNQNPDADDTSPNNNNNDNAEPQPTQNPQQTSNPKPLPTPPASPSSSSAKTPETTSPLEESLKKLDS